MNTVFLSNGLGVIADPTKPGSYDDRYPWVSAVEARQIERLIAAKYSATDINSISETRNAYGFTMPGTNPAGTKAQAQAEFLAQINSLNTQKQQLAIQTASAQAKIEADNAAKAKSQADALVVLKQANLINNSDAVNQASKVYSQINTQNTPQTTQPSNTGNGNTNTVLIVGGIALLLTATVVTVAVVSKKSKRKEYEKS